MKILSHEIKVFSVFVGFFYLKVTMATSVRRHVTQDITDIYVVTPAHVTRRAQSHVTPKRESVYVNRVGKVHVTSDLQTS